MTEISKNQIIKKAKAAARNSYSPYSNFSVGAAFSDQHGNVYHGCNVENLAFPSGVCAEKTAIAKGISEIGPEMKIKMLVVYTPTQTVTTPCGGCRQFIGEFSTSETMIICVCDSEEYLEVPFQDLLPDQTKIKLKK